MNLHSTRCYMAAK